MSEHWVHAEDAGRYLPEMPLPVLVALLRAIADELEARDEDRTEGDESPCG